MTRTLGVFFIIMESEIWKDVVGYEGLYQVSNLGRIKRLPSVVKNRYIKGGLLKPRKHNSGYLSVYLCKNGVCEQWLLHRIVAMAFIPNPKNLPQINHKDSNRRNTFASNLEWCTQSYNIKYAYDHNHKKEKMQWYKGAKCISAKPVRSYSKSGEFVKEYGCIQDAVNETGILNSSISNCLKGRSKTAGGLIWKYKKQ